MLSVIERLSSDIIFPPLLLSFSTMTSNMDQVIPGLWIGGLLAALDTETLKANNIFSVLTAMRGKISIHETFIKHQILLDDTEEQDVLVHFIPAITFIQTELDKGRGVLVHCQAGVSE
jgi:dual specificity phosphatase 12